MCIRDRLILSVWEIRDLKKRSLTEQMRAMELPFEIGGAAYAAPLFPPFLKKIFEMAERCNNSACFSVEIKGTSDSYSSSKSLMIILPFMEEAICYCNNAKLMIESFSYLGQLHNYICLLYTSFKIYSSPSFAV